MTYSEQDRLGLLRWFNIGQNIGKWVKRAQLINKIELDDSERLNDRWGTGSASLQTAERSNLAWSNMLSMSHSDINMPSDWFLYSVLKHIYLLIF